MLLASPVRLPYQPLKSADPVQLRRDTPEPKPGFEQALGAARRSAFGSGAAVVQFGAVALGLARQARASGAAPADTGGTEAAEVAPDDESSETQSDARAAADESAPSTSAQPSVARGAEAGNDEGGKGEDGSAERSDAERQEIAELKRRDSEVRTHEQAHKATGGAYTGSIRLSYQMGPDGKRYAVEGSVPIDVSPIPGDPAATLRKMEVVHRAANAPASPSSADRGVAAQAQRVTQQARAQMAAERYAQASELLPRA
jgi:SprA family protein